MGRRCYETSMPRCPTNVDNSRTRVYCAFNRCGLGLLGLFLYRLLYLFSFSSSVSDGSKKTEICLKELLNPNQPISHQNEHLGPISRHSYNSV